jgi:hypothetical protein
MASEAQVLANRRNAEKSTGPRTEEGKAVVSQNAVKHGLLARQDVIGSEDRDEFELHRRQMMEELNPGGPVETMLAERIVSLSWRLKRAERIQSEALDCLLSQDLSGSGGDPDPAGADPDLALGRAVVRDFGNERVLDRLLMYERRIEHSLYKAISELDRMKLLKPFSGTKGVQAEAASLRDRDLDGGRMRPDTWPRTLGSPSGDPLNRQTSPEPDKRQLCKTNPIPGGVEGWQPAEVAVRSMISGPPDSPCRVAVTG